MSAGGAAEGFGELFKSLSPEPAPTSIVLGDGHCDHGLQVSGTISDADVGAPLQLKSAQMTVTAPAHTGAGFVYYDSTTGSTSPDDSVWTVSNTGGPDLAAQTIGTIHVPKIAVLSGPVQFISGAPVTVTWTGGNGADSVLVEMPRAADVVVCWAKPGTSFTVPADVTAQVPGNTTVSVYAITMKRVRINGRDVVLEGIAVPVGP